MDPRMTFGMMPDMRGLGGLFNRPMDIQSLIAQGVDPFEAQQIVQQQGMPQLDKFGFQQMTPGIENLDRRAIEADPEGFETFLQAAQEQETLMPGSTFLGEQQKFEQDMAQQLLPPPPGFTPPTIGNTGGIGRDMGIAPPSFGGGTPPLAPPFIPTAYDANVTKNPFQKINDPIPQSTIDQFQGVAGKPNPFVPPETANFARGPGFLGGKRPLKAPPIDKRDDFMSIEQLPNPRIDGIGGFLGKKLGKMGRR